MLRVLRLVILMCLSYSNPRPCRLAGISNLLILRLIPSPDVAQAAQLEPPGKSKP